MILHALAHWLNNCKDIILVGLTFKWLSGQNINSFNRDRDAPCSVVYILHQVDLPTKLFLANGVVSGMEYLHCIRPHPVIHGDLKVQNILVGDGLVAKVCLVVYIYCWYNDEYDYTILHQIVKLFFIKPVSYRDGKRLDSTHNNDNSVESKIISEQQLDSLELVTEGRPGWVHLTAALLQS